MAATLCYPDWQRAFPQFNDTISLATFDGVIVPMVNATVATAPWWASFCDPNLQLQLLNLMAAHWAQLLFGTVAGQPPSALVGRITNASEGSVSVAAEMAGATAASAWYQQTPFGAAYWQLTTVQRLGFYAPKITPRVQPQNYPYAVYGLPYGRGRL